MFSSKRIPTLGFIIILLISWISMSSCRYYSLERKLDAVNKEWLDEVGYIITPEEKKMFLDLPKAEKEDFKKEFWQRRDPDPYTEENEYKEIYYNRIEEANEQFVGETKPGYLTDRGRIYILFGPPMDRLRYDTRSSRCQETWYYGGFPVVFIDEYCTGKYYLVTYDLTSLRTYNLQYMHDLNRAQADAQQTIVGESGFMNFDFYVEDTVAQTDLVAGLVRLEIPLAEIWFKEKDGIMTTDIKVDLEIWDADEKLVWEYHDSLEVITNEDELQADSGKKYETVIPFEIEKGFESLYKGENRLFVVLTNTTGEHSLRKVRSFRLK